METFDVPLYNGELTVCVFTDLKEAIKQCGFKYDNEAEHYESLAIRTDSDQFYAFIPVDVSPGVLASTARRVCKYIFDNERIKISSEQIQHECRLLEWVVDTIYVVLNDKKIKTVYAEN